MKNGEHVTVNPAPIAAYHGVGHIVAAFFSRYYRLAPGTISLGAYGSGAADVALSRKKLTTAEKILDPSAEQDPEVAASLAIVYAAGLAAERIAERKHSTLRANPAAARPDHLALVATAAAARIPARGDPYEQEAAALLEREWDVVEALARSWRKPARSMLFGRRNTLRGIAHRDPSILIVSNCRRLLRKPRFRWMRERHPLTGRQGPMRGKSL
jgi:hypothetical protein